MFKHVIRLLENGWLLPLLRRRDVGGYLNYSPAHLIHEVLYVNTPAEVERGSFVFGHGPEKVSQARNVGTEPADSGFRGGEGGVGGRVAVADGEARPAGDGVPSGGGGGAGGAEFEEMRVGAVYAKRAASAVNFES